MKEENIQKKGLEISLADLEIKIRGQMETERHNYEKEEYWRNVNRYFMVTVILGLTTMTLNMIDKVLMLLLN